MEVVDIPLDQLCPASWNPNSMTPAMRARLMESISRYGAVEPLLVRRVNDGYYEVLSGNQRHGVYIEMGIEMAPCVVVELNDAQAMLLAQVLNRTRGEDNLGLKAELLRQVIETVPKEQVLGLLPETAEGLEALLTLGQEDLGTYLEEWEKTRSARLRTLQVRLTQDQLEVVEKALERFRPMAREENGPSPNLRGTALYLLCKQFLGGREGNLP